MDDDLKIQRALLRIFFYSVMGNVCNVGYESVFTSFLAV